MKKTICAMGFVICLSVGVLFHSATARGDSCPADEHDGVRVQGCQIGDDIQVLVHNSNSYDVSIDVNVSYREKSGAIRSRSFHGRADAFGGGEIGEIQVRPYRTLSEVTDVTLKDVIKR